jgi:hypothetical protein
MSWRHLRPGTAPAAPRKRTSPLYISFSPFMRMPVLADDDVIVHGDAERPGDVDDRARHLDIRLRRRWIARGVIVHDIVPANTMLKSGEISSLARRMGAAIGGG